MVQQLSFWDLFLLFSDPKIAVPGPWLLSPLLFSLLFPFRVLSSARAREREEIGKVVPACPTLIRKGNRRRAATTFLSFPSSSLSFSTPFSLIRATENGLRET